MFNNKPVDAAELDQVLKPYLSAEFTTHRLGSFGLFVCGPNGSLPLMKLTHDEAEHLLHGREIDGTGQIEPANREAVAWKLSYNIPVSVDVLRALASERIALAIQSAQEKSALTSLRELAGCLHGSTVERGELGKLLDYQGLGEGWLPKPQILAKEALSQSRTEQTSCAFVVFNSVASPRQNPELQSTAFLINTVQDNGGEPKELLASMNMHQIKSAISTAYKSALEFHLRGVIGSPDQNERIAEVGIRAVPEVLTHLVFQEPRFDRGWPDNPNIKEMNQKQLMAKWQKQAEKAHWGPKEVRGLLRDMMARQIREEFARHQEPSASPKAMEKSNNQVFFEELRQSEQSKIQADLRLVKDLKKDYSQSH